MSNILPNYFNTPVGDWPAKLGLDINKPRVVQVLYDNKLYWRNAVYFEDSLEFTPINHWAKDELVKCIERNDGMLVIPVIKLTVKVIHTYTIDGLMGESKT